jgi:hypothetical protein
MFFLNKSGVRGYEFVDSLPSGRPFARVATEFPPVSTAQILAGTAPKTLTTGFSDGIMAALLGFAENRRIIL